MKLHPMPVLQRCLIHYLKRSNFSNAKHVRNISTSKKNSETATTACDPSKQNDNWVSYGFDYKDKTEDTNVHHASYFFSVSVCLVLGGFFWAYAPDAHMRDWAQREAFLELRRREKCGSKPIDPNYVDPTTVELPADSELCDIEIII